MEGVSGSFEKQEWSDKLPEKGTVIESTIGPIAKTV